MTEFKALKETADDILSLIMYHLFENHRTLPKAQGDIGHQYDEIALYKLTKLKLYDCSRSHQHEQWVRWSENTRSIMSISRHEGATRSPIMIQHIVSVKYLEEKNFYSVREKVQIDFLFTE